MIKLYNTLSRQTEPFKPLDGKEVHLFVCGPTVYDDTHIGHAKTYIQMDTIARFLKQQGYNVTYLQNITDLDDKIIQRARENEQNWQDLRTKYEHRYYEDMQTLNNTTVDIYARATDYIDDIIRQVQALLDKRYAYVIADGVYFEVSKFAKYGQLSGRAEVKEEDAQSRIDQSDNKRGWNDFCLWKFSKPGEPVWDAPFGKGRPGWHIEDTAITEHHFGSQYDIHGGAVDLIFPHHEAELTQMEAISNKTPFVRYWIHTGFLNVNNAKMSKSKGNFFTIREVIEKGYDPLAIRLMMLQAHYRSELNFSWEALDAAQNRLHDLRAWADLRHQPSSTHMTAELDNLFLSTKEDIITALSKDLNTPAAFTALNRLVSYMQTIPIPGEDGKHTDGMLAFLDTVFGLELSSRPDITKSQKDILAKRQIARDANDWASADSLRKQLEDQKLGIRDTAFGQQWYRL